MKHFVVDIEMSNDAMSDAQDIIRALKRVMIQLEERVGQELKPFHSRTIMDINGNSVGSWNIEERV
jgi:hypothetical protein